MMHAAPNSPRAETRPTAGAPEDARPGDFEALTALLHACGLPVEDLTQQHLAHFRVCRAGAAPVAAIGLEIHGAAGLLRSLAVAVPYRGLGLGTTLVGDLERRAAAHGVETLYLLTTTAERFFARRGYRTVDRASVPPAVAAAAEFTRLCPSSATCMARAQEQ